MDDGLGEVRSVGGAVGEMNSERKEGILDDGLAWQLYFLRGAGVQQKSRPMHACSAHSYV